MRVKNGVVPNAPGRNIGPPTQFKIVPNPISEDSFHRVLPGRRGHFVEALQQVVRGRSMKRRTDAVKLHRPDLTA